MAAAAEMPAGEPRKQALRSGPMISEDDARRARSWLDEAADAQAHIECGGRDGSAPRRFVTQVR